MKAIDNQTKSGKKPAKFKKIVKAFTLGAVTGVGIGMWLSSEKGKLVKDKVLDFIQDWAEKSKA